MFLIPTKSLFSTEKNYGGQFWLVKNMVSTNKAHGLMFLDLFIHLLSLEEAVVHVILRML